MSADDASIDEEQRYRASAYALLAALLRAPPQTPLLEQLEQLSPQGDEEPDDLAAAMAELAAAAAQQRDLDALEDEYTALFIGVGRGELVPYGSWYLTGFLMEQPLSDLRDDLAALGFERSAATHEPEDHIAAIFEVFSVMISDNFSPSRQQRFYLKHMKPWLERFFTDLENARTADFYRYVARFGAAFIKLETTYLSMRS